MRWHTCLAVPDLDVLTVLFIALALSADCFAVALTGSISMRSVSFAQTLRTAIVFGVFQGAMPALGWLAGRTIVDLIGGYDHWVAFALLALVGGRMVWESFRSRGKEEGMDITRGALLLTLAVATSIDALAVGLSFAFVEVSIALACSVIGIVAFCITVAGFKLGAKVGTVFGKRAELIGGVILIGIGLRILLTHIL